MYKLIKEGQAVQRLLNGALIPFDKDNTDYQQFKKDLANGVELKDAEGNQMTPEQITTFLEGLA
jgi:hypothetical protein